MGSHFGGKDALAHVVEKREEGIKEIHGTELPGHFASGTDSFRETAFLLLIFSLFIPNFTYLLILSLGWIAWKMGRSGWLGWTRLERLHRIIEQEKFEIEHHRPQERSELTALYKAKGFEGKLLEDVVDVLMSDQDRLLKVMLEEELGLTLEAYEHPLKQAIGAGVGAMAAAILCLAGFVLSPTYGILLAALFVIGLGAFLTAKYEKNRLIAAVVWNISFAILGFGIIYFLL